MNPPLSIFHLREKCSMLFDVAAYNSGVTFILWQKVFIETPKASTFFLSLI